MSAESAGDGPSSVRWRRIGVRVLYGLLAAAAIYVLVRNLDHPNDFRHFRDFGRATLAGQFPYDPAVEALWHPGTWATWPPSFMPVAVLLARLDAAIGQAATIALWQAANLAALAVVLVVGVRWLYGRRLALGPLPGEASAGAVPDTEASGGSGRAADGPADASARSAGPGLARTSGRGRLPLWSLAAMAGILVPARLLLSNFEHTQANLLMLGLAVAGFALFRRGRRTFGGLAVGLSTAIKATPLMLLPYLVWRGRWKDLGSAVAGCVATWGILPAVAVGPGRVGDWYAAWWERTGALHLPTSGMNQSLQATLTRLFAPGGLQVPQGPGAGSLGGYGAEVWVVVAAALVGLAAAVAFGRPFRRVSARREALELGVVVTGMGLFAPIGWKFHFVGLLLLALALYATLPRARRWILGPGQDGAVGADGTGARRGLAAGGENATDPKDGAVDLRTLRGGNAGFVAAALVFAAAAVNLTATDIVGGGRADVLERYGVVTWSALLLVAAGLWALWRGRTTVGETGVAGQDEEQALSGEGSDA